MSHAIDETDFKLANPPIVEAWIRVTFLPTENAEPWDWNRVVSFLQGYSPELDTIEGLPEPPKVVKVKRSQKKNQLTVNILTEPGEPRYFRARNSDSTQIVQVGKTELLVSLMRDGSTEYGGFARLLAFFHGVLEDLESHVGTRSIQLLELHYVDVIQIPFLDNMLDIKQYFSGVPELSGPPFGDMWQVNWSVNLIPPGSSDSSQLSVQCLPPEPNEMRFRLDWHRASELENPSREIVINRLTESHGYLKQCFRAFCRPKTWSLFGPQQDDSQ